MVSLEADGKWRENLLATLSENGVTHPPPESSYGRSLIAVAVLVYAAATIPMLLLAFSFEGSSSEEQPNCYHVVANELKAAGIKYDREAVAILVPMCEEARARKEADESSHRALFAAAMAILYPIGGLIYVRFLVQGWRILTPDAFAELDRLPNRRPVLFLRSFSRDPSEKLTFSALTLGDDFERQVVRELHSGNPVIAIGKPSEKLQPRGAGRLYIPDERWQAMVLELLPVCELVFLVYGSTPGVLWELQTIVLQLEPSKLIVCIPSDGKRKRRNGPLEGWEEFIHLSRNIFPKPLPADPGKALFLRFDSSWQPILVEPKARLHQARRVRSALRSMIESRP